MLKQVVELKPLLGNVHCDNDFREQIAVLWPGSLQQNLLLVHKSQVAVCQPGLASFDSKNPGVSSWESWQTADAYVTAGAVGFYHTHPRGSDEFSELDMSFISSLAQANGSKYMWHVMQPYGECFALCVCAHMKPRGNVIIYRFGKIATDPFDTILALPTPPMVSDVSDNTIMFNLELSDE